MEIHHTCASNGDMHVNDTYSSAHMCLKKQNKYKMFVWAGCYIKCITPASIHFFKWNSFINSFNWPFT